MPERERQMLLIGAGPVGLAVAKALREAEIAADHVEATDHVGGNWAHGVYETAHIISSRKTTEYPDHPMPAGTPDFPSRAQMAAYYRDFAEAHGLKERIRFHKEVVAVRPEGEGRGYSVRFADGEEACYKGVIVCNGHHWSREFPPWAGAFSGELLHSKDYKSPDQLEGRRVLVVGGGNSGCDVASEAARVGVQADWSLRRGMWILPKTVFGIPSVELMQAWAPIWLQRLFIRGLVRLCFGSYERHGLPRPEHKIFDTHPTVNSEIFHYLQHGRVRPRPDVRAVEGRRVVFVDGAEAEYDLVVCATGYAVSFPFLPEGTVPIDGKTARVHGGSMLPEHRHLYLVGTTQPRYGLGPLIRPYAVQLARWIKLQDELHFPLGRAMQLLRLGPEPSHLVDPHKALRSLAVVRHLDPLLRWADRRLQHREGRGGEAHGAESALADGRPGA